jgi:hypothetical protein
MYLDLPTGQEVSMTVLEVTKSEDKPAAAPHKASVVKGGAG